MASFTEFQKKNRVEAARRSLETKRNLWIHRPIYLHERATKPGKCPCCGDRNSHRVDTIQHLDVLIDRVTGQRKVRQHLTREGQVKFDNLAAQAQRIDCPIRAYAKQVAIITDRKHAVIGVFGGNRAGKTTAEAEWLFDQMLEHGGRQVSFWWVSETRKHALLVGLKKLITGEGRGRSIIPPELVVSYPRSAAHDVPAVLIDGTLLYFHHASTPEADNLRGQSPACVVLDEGCSITHEANWDQLLMRLTDSDGQILTATTPKLGHWLQKNVRERGKSYDELADLDADAYAANDCVYATLSQRDNPWLSKRSIERRIVALGNDELKIRAEIDGEWVAIGRQLWRHFDEPTHLREGPWRDVSGWGLVNITKMAAARFFHRTESTLDIIAGQDFNLDPHNVVIAQIAVPKGCDPADRNNWIVFVLDLVQKAGTITEFAAFLAEGAARERKLPATYFSKLAIACDPSGAHSNPHKSHGLRGASTLANEMRRRGFDCRPCNVSEKNEATMPSQLDSISLLHKLMSDRVKAPDGVEWPRLVIHGTRCAELVYSLQTQLATPRGGIAKVPGTNSDVISGPTDALRYLAWAVPGLGAEYQTRKATTSFGLTRAA